MPTPLVMTWAALSAAVSFKGTHSALMWPLTGEG